MAVKRSLFEQRARSANDENFRIGRGEEDSNVPLKSPENASRDDDLAQGEGATIITSVPCGERDEAREPE